MNWAKGVLRRMAPRDRRDDVVGDFEEAHRRHMRQYGRFGGQARSVLDAFDMAVALLRMRLDLFGIYRGSGTMQDYRLALRMLRKYPGLTIAGGLALAIAIGLGSAWYEITNQGFHPRLPLADPERIVSVEMRNSVSGGTEARLLFDFAGWQRNARSFEALAAYRTVERNLGTSETAPELVIGAETTASVFTVARVAPVLGRPLYESDAQPGAPEVAVIGYAVWQRQFGGRTDIIGQTVQVGHSSTTVVGVMPKGFKFPVNHGVWVPLRHTASAPLDGPAIRIFGRLAPGVSRQQANAEMAALGEHAAAASPKTHDRLRPRVLVFGAELVGEKTWVAYLMTHLPILLILGVACANVATLVYARTATREAEITMRYALGATRGRIITQLFVEALMLAAIAAVVGLVAANGALKWALDVFTGGHPAALPFWISPGLRFTTVVYAAALAVAGAAMVGVLPAIKATGSNAQSQLRNLGTGGSTLRFGKIWTAAMIGQVAMTVVCVPFVAEFAVETRRDLAIRGRFPAGRYLAAHLSFDRTVLSAEGATSETRLAQAYGEIDRRVAQQPDVVAVTFAAQLPGVGHDVRSAEIEASPGAQPTHVPVLWTNTVGPRFFETFEVPILAGRDFHDGDRTAAARTIIVNEAFARRLLGGATPIGRRVRYVSSDAAKPEPWFEIVGMVRDIGMTPGSRGEAPYIFRAATPSPAAPLLMGVRVAGDPASLAPRVRAIVAEVDPAIRLAYVQPLRDVIWQQDLPTIVLASGVTGVVALALFLSAFGIYSLMAVSIARRTREIGLRVALGATQTRLLLHVFRRALVLIVGGIATGSAALLLFAFIYVTYVEPLDLKGVINAVLLTSSVMLAVGVLGCLEPARRALRIHPADALKDA